ncbi:hypothetical protein ACFLU6_16010 [Acidobacteriota bacterium]
MKNILALVVSIFACLLLADIAFSDCDIVNVCADVSVSLKGTIQSTDAIIEWETDSENTDLKEYQVYRFDCEYPQCYVYVTTVTPNGTCDETEPYRVEDTPPSPVSSWTYQVRVINVSAMQQCSINVEPE